MLAKDLKFKLGSLTREDGVSTKTPNETLNLIMETHFPGSDSNSSGIIEYERCSVETLSPDRTVISEPDILSIDSKRRSSADLVSN